MGIDFNSFFDAMKNIASINGQAGIQQGVEADLAQSKFIEFKKDMAMTAPIDSFERKNDGIVDNLNNNIGNISVDDLMTLLDAPELNIDLVNKYIGEEPVSDDTKNTMAKIGEVKQPEAVESMAILADGDTDAINFYNNLAYTNNNDKNINNTTDGAELAMDIIGPKGYDALMQAFA